MAKYNYMDGERRYYRGVIIWYDLNSEQHWYIVMIYQFNQRNSSANPPNPYHIERVYFNTLSEAKRYIDEF